MFDKDQKILESLLMEKILNPPPAGDGDRWNRKLSPEEPEITKWVDKQSAEKIAKDSTQKMHLGQDPEGLGEKLLTLTIKNGVKHGEVKAHLQDIALKGFFPQVKQYLQYVKNTMKFKPEVRQAATALLITYGFNESEETIGDKPEFSKAGPSSWEEYKKLLMWGADMDPKQLKNLSPEERKKRIDKFFKPPR